MPDSGSNPIRRTVLFSGYVQGVGFRWTAEAVAGRHKVAGYVRNLRDGRVELVAEGAPDELDRFITALHERMREYIQDVNASDAPATGEFSGFGIRH